MYVRIICPRRGKLLTTTDPSQAKLKTLKAQLMHFFYQVRTVTASKTCTHFDQTCVQTYIGKLFLKSFFGEVKQVT